MKKKRGLKRVVPYLILIVLSCLYILPVTWLAVSAFNPAASQAFTIPDVFSLDNFREVLKNSKNMTGFSNSFIISISQTVIVVVCALLAAYPLSRFHLKNAQKIVIGLLFFTSIPITAVMVPVYQLFVSMQLIDSLLGVVLFLSASALPYAIWMMRNFLDTVSVDLEEAAWIDGASKRQSITRIILPLIAPGIFTVAIYTFVGSWGNFFVPFILLSRQVTASTNIYNYFGNTGVIMYGQLAAYSLSYIVPSFVLYFFAQNYVSKGFAMDGATKG